MGKISSDAIARFKELHPERFAELKTEAERDWSKPTPRRTISYTPTTTLPPDRLPDWYRRGLTLEQALEEFRAEHGGRHFLITTAGGHRYFEGGWDEEDAVKKLSRHSSYLGEAVTSIEEAL